jgi:hypothetical protein
VHTYETAYYLEKKRFLLICIKRLDSLSLLPAPPDKRDAKKILDSKLLYNQLIQGL